MVLLYHHCIPLRKLKYDIIRPSKKHSLDGHGSDSLFVNAYLWFEKQMGYYPLFLAVGKRIIDIRITGYHNNWRRVFGSESERTLLPNGEYKVTYKPIHRKAENLVLLSFDECDGVYNDYQCWHFALNYPLNITPYQTSQIFKKSWTKARWIKYATTKKYGVQICPRELDLRKAKRVWVRNEATKQLVEKMGFKNVHVRRITLADYLAR